METRWTCNSPPGTIICILCRGFISFDKTVNIEDFFSHLKNEHRIHINHRLILAVNLLTSEKIRQVVATLDGVKKEEDTLGGTNFAKKYEVVGFTNESTDLEDGEITLPALVNNLSANTTENSQVDNFANKNENIGLEEGEIILQMSKSLFFAATCSGVHPSQSAGFLFCD